MRRPPISPSASRRVRALLACGILLATGVLGTTALWSTSAATVSDEFRTATLDITANDQVVYNFGFPGQLFPGDETGYLVTIRNVGSTAFTYTASVSSNDALGQALLLKAVVGGTPSDTGCSGTATGGTYTIDDTPKPFLEDRGPLAAGTGAEALCLQVGIAGTFMGNLAGATGEVTFTFDAESVT